MERLIDIVANNVRQDPLALQSLWLRIQLIGTVFLLIGATAVQLAVDDLVLIR